ncbi:heparinase II/III family protein [Candidatus Latescibacterota bacterium]
MKKILVLAVIALIGLHSSVTYSETALEEFTYTQDFETGELSAWASYPFWQDTAYDPNFRVNTIVPGDPNISIEQTVTPYTNVDNYAGAQKLLDMYMIPGSTITLRYYVKTNLPAEFVKVRLAACVDGQIDYTVSNPATNVWEWVTLTFDDLIRQNPKLAGKDRIKINALAVLAKIPNADPDMPIFFGLDDVTFKGAREVQFRFNEPGVIKLSEWKPYISDHHFSQGDALNVSGNLPVDADRMAFSVVPYTDSEREIESGRMRKRGDVWSAELTLSYPTGLYLVKLEAYDDNEIISETELTFYIAPGNLGGNHPRIMFDNVSKSQVVERLKSDRFKNVAENIVNTAKNRRENNPVEKMEYDVDQFWGGDISATWGSNITPWFARINVWRSGILNSALAYNLLDDNEAGAYGKALLLKLSTYPQWVHPWWKDRGYHIYYPIGELGMDLAVGYDLLYDLMNENERLQVRNSLTDKIVRACHKGYVEDNLVTNDTSNWVAHITGGSIMCQAAMYGDGQDVEPVEPYFTGAMFKTYDLVSKAFGSDGSYGEGYGYYNFTMQSLSKSLPAIDMVFNIDMSENIRGTYKELIWAGMVKEKKTYYFGDSSGGLGALTNWAWLLAKHKDPLLGWFYNHQKTSETFMDVLYETADVPRDDPFDENPVAVFKDVGTTVFKSGWEPDDFVFIMRTGAFYNHQHLDQGSFWLSDRGSAFIEERHGSTYYDDPIYQSWYTQPIAHSTILIDGNHQSQRAGDPLVFAEGFEEHAFISQFLEGDTVAFSSGDIGRLYWGKVKELQRNVLYLKPRTLLMLDTVIPSERDVDITLLYQTAFLNDINVGDDVSTISKGGNMLNIRHMFPENMNVQSVETPHYLYTLRNERPLEREGMLTVTARTDRRPLVMANLLTTSGGDSPEIEIAEGDGYMSGTIESIPFAFSTRLSSVYTAGKYETDALALSWRDSNVLAALCTTLGENGVLLVTSSEPMTFELSGNEMRYSLSAESVVQIHSPGKPAEVTVNGELMSNYKYNAEKRMVLLTVDSGEGTIDIK